MELAGIGPAQHGAMLLADLGADIIRVDRPGTAGSRSVLDRGRRSIGIDLKDRSERDTALALIASGDVLIDPYRPGVLERLGLAPAELCERNPGLVVARMTGWGQDGPLAHVAGHDINYVALAGALEAIGSPETVPPVPLNVVGDFGGGGMMLAFSIMVALFERERSGLGQVLDVAMVDGVASLMSGVLSLRELGDWDPRRGTNWLQGAAPWYRAYRTADDGFITVGSLEEKFYALLLERLGLDATRWPQWDTERWPALIAELERVFAARDLDAWRHALEGTDACFAPALRLAEAARHPHLAARGTYVTREDGTLEPGVVPRLSRTPGSLPGRAPAAGAHRVEILEELAAEQTR